MTTAHVADALAAQLNNSGSATIYVDIAGISQDTTTIMTDSDPPLHAEFDQVRGLFAVRKATDEELDEAEAAAAAKAKPAAKPASSTAA